MAWDQKEITAYLVDVDTGDYLDFQYNPNDIVDEAVDFSTAGTYILKAAPGNLKWIGQVEVAITMDLVDINTMITDGDVDGFVAPTLS